MQKLHACDIPAIVHDWHSYPSSNKSGSSSDKVVIQLYTALLYWSLSMLIHGNSPVIVFHFMMTIYIVPPWPYIFRSRHGDKL